MIIAEALKEEGRVGKLTIEGFKIKNIEGCERTVRDNDRGTVEGRMRDKVKHRGPETGNY
jgi:hypothetical protein